MPSPSAFEWDEAKSSANAVARDIPFDAAPAVFLDPRRVEFEDDRFDYGETRWTTIGVVDGVTLHVTYTLRGDVARIISVRRASRRERKFYGNHP